VTAFGTAPDRRKPVIAGTLWGWQYCSRGRVPGIGGSVDLDVVYGAVSGQETQQQDGNPYPVPTAIVTSTAQAAAKGVIRWVPQGPQVEWVQWELQRLGYDLGKAGVDGICGSKTVAAIEAFQRCAGLTVDGLCGPRTVAALQAAKDKPKAPDKTAEPVNYRSRVANGAQKVYDAVVKYRCRHKSGADTLEEIIEKRITTCSSSVTAALKEAGLMQQGKLGHRPKDGKSGATKTTPEKVFYGLEYLDKSKVDIVMVDKLYKDLPEKYKRPGVIYAQDSNICISAGNGEIYSTNEGGSQMRDGVYVKDKVDKGYPYSHRILAVIVAKE
jgi:N-acetylmuramoyl-L-alanine amidase/peptidoglycan L-alanyl-D-glutamate endopeptidase CwlK